MRNGITECAGYFEGHRMLLKDQVALVTGGSRGIGKAIVQALAREGAKVTFVYRGSAGRRDALEQEVAAAGGVAKAVQADVADPTAAEAVVARGSGGTRAGRYPGEQRRRHPRRAVPPDGADDWNTVIDTNLNGTFAFCKAVAHQMAFKQRSGRIINVSSVAAEHVNTGQTNYAASKGAINSFTRVLAAELGAGT